MGASFHHASYTDSRGTAWGGIPLWYLVGFADDAVGGPTGSHGSGTFNNALAAAGYTITVTGSDRTATLASKDVARSNAYIIATTMNGAPVKAFRLVGAGVPAAQEVDGVTSISISLGSTPTPVPTPTVKPTIAPNRTPTPTVTPTITPTQPVTAATTLNLTGAVTRTITQSYFTAGVAAGHQASFTDRKGIVWDGMPLWYLAGMVDDIIQHGPGAFNDALAAGGYTITVRGRDGKQVNLDSRLVARNDTYLIANKKNGVPIPFTDPSAPFSLVGSGAGSGVQGVTSITVTGTPVTTVTTAPTTRPVTTVPTAVQTTTIPAGGSISLSGAQSVTISADYFARGASIHAGSYTDGNGAAWGGVPLWYLAGFADDTTGGPSGGHGSGTFNDDLADAGYTITVTGSSGSVTLDSASVKRNDAYLIANTKDGSPTGYSLVGDGPGIGSGVQGVSSISLNLGGLTPAPTPTRTVNPTAAATQAANAAANTAAWTIAVGGKMDKKVTKSWFEGGIAAGHAGTYTDPEGKTWDGMPLWYFAGLSDDDNQHGPGAFSDEAAEAGYTITVFGKNGKNVVLDSNAVARSDRYLIAEQVDGAPLPAADELSPVALVGEGIDPSEAIGGVDRIVLTFPDAGEAGAASSGDRPTTGSTGPKTVDGRSSAGSSSAGGSAASNDSGTPMAEISLFPTFTFKIAFTPFPEILIQYGQPPATGTAAPGGTTAAAGADGVKTAPVTADTLALSGAIDDTVTVRKVVDGVAYGHEGGYTDAKGNTWTGMPLWFFAGWVDDEDSHSPNAYNDDVARTGYNITVTGTNGETVISGTDAMRSNGFLIATSKNGEQLTADNGGPLTLVGANVPEEYQVTGVSAISLDLPHSG
jgi:hypothetical protein